MAETKYETEYEFDGHIFNSFGQLIEAWKDKRCGLSEAEAKNRMLYWYKKDKGLDPAKSKVIFEGKIRPTGRKFPKKPK